MPLHFSLQNAVPESPSPKKDLFLLWTESTLQEIQYNKDCELCIRLIDIEESQQLNHTYRNKNKATNVLSFPAELLEMNDLLLLGDIAICAPLVAREAAEQNKIIQAHWAHLVIHGVLHLLSYDHINPDESDRMETLEIEILKKLGFANPYL